MPPAYVKDLGSANSKSSSTTLAITLGVSASVGNCVLVAVGGLTQSTDIASCADSQGNTYTRLGGQSYDLGVGRLAIFASILTTGLASSDTITATWASAVSTRVMAAIEASGITSLTLDGSTPVTIEQTVASASMSNGPTATTSNADDFLWAMWLVSNGTATFDLSPDSPWVETQLATTGNTGTNRSIGTQYRVVSATGAYTATATQDASRVYDGVLVALPGAAAAGDVTVTVPAAAQVTLDALAPALEVDVSFSVALNLLSDSVVGFPTDVTGFVRSISINRGASSDGVWPPHYQAGTATLVLDNSDGRFDPFNNAGPYEQDGLSLIVPRRVWIQIAVNDGDGESPVFTGSVERWVPSYPATGKDAVCAAHCVDFTARLSSIDRTGGTAVGSDEVTSDRIERILDALGGFDDREISQNTGLTQNALDSTTLSGNVWAELQLTADSEPGEIFIGADGSVVFRDKAYLFGAAGSITLFAFSDETPPTNGFRDLTLASDATLVKNEVRVRSADLVDAEALDLASMDAFGILTYVRQDLLFIDDGADPGTTQRHADLLLSVMKDADPRVETLTIMPSSDPGNLWTAVKNLDLGDRVSVRFQPPGGVDPIDRVCAIRSIAHTAGAHFAGWITTYGLDDAQRITGLIFDDAHAGRLDFGRFGFVP